MRIYNTPVKDVVDFKPQTEGSVKLYTCGPTVYDYITVGNWVSYIRWDILVRALRSSGLEVNRVMNITDVGHLVSDADEGEDKLEKGAKREGKTAWEIAEFYTQDFLKGMQQLSLLPPAHYARATDFIDDQINLIKILETKGYTYVITDGVYYDTSKFPRYADFAGLDLADQKAGARVAVNPEKRNPSDFALWKLSPKDSQRDMEWDSPWGKGFPGWHLECSAIALKFLGPTLDIHTGGIDHIPVHHTNEIAQSEAVTGQRFSNYWLHNNFLQVAGQKISKSLGNVFSLQDISQRGFSPLDFKLFVLQSHYRSESNFTWENLQAAKNRHQSFKAMADLRWQASDSGLLTIDDINKSLNLIKQALENDLDTPAVLAELSAFEELAKSKLVHKNLAVTYANFIIAIDELLGLELSKSDDISSEQKQTIIERQKARDQQDWEKSDELRGKLMEQGIELNDLAHGSIWSRI